LFARVSNAHPLAAVLRSAQPPSIVLATGVVPTSDPILLLPTGQSPCSAGMDGQQVLESIRGMVVGLRGMDARSIARAWPASTTLLCVLVVLQTLRATRKQEEPRRPPAAMSAAALAALVLLDLVLSHWVFVLVTFVYLFS